MDIGGISKSDSALAPLLFLMVIVIPYYMGGPTAPSERYGRLVAHT